MNFRRDKLIEAISFNTLGTILSFLGTLLIARFESVEVVGQIHYALALAGLFSILLLVVPPNYLVLKFLDNVPNVKHLTGFYGLIAGLILLVAGALSGIGLLPTALPLFLFHRIVNNIVDISLQGCRKSQELYILSFLSGVVRITYIIFALWLGISIYEWYWIFLVISSGFYLFWIRKIILLFRPKYYSDVIRFFREDNIKRYYQYDIIKNIRSNGTSVFFKSVLSLDNYGIYSLFVKVLGFISGYFRITETFIFTGDSKVLDNINRVSKFLLTLVILTFSSLLALLYVWLNSGLFLFSTSVIWAVMAVIRYEISSKRGYLMAKEFLREMACSEVIHCIPIIFCLFSSYQSLEVFEVSLLLLLSILMQYIYVRIIYKRAFGNL